MISSDAGIQKFRALSRGYTSDFLLATVMQFFLEIVASPASGGGYTSDKSVILSRKVQLI